MDKKPKDEKPVEKSKADLLRTAASKSSGKCEKCAAADKDQPSMSPMVAGLLSRLGFLGLPGLGGGCPHAHGVIVITKKDEPEKAPNADEPDGQKKVLEKEKSDSVAEAKTHHTSPFVQRCVAAMTGGSPASQDAESSAFAMCNATKNKSKKDLDKSAKERPGYRSRKAEFEQSLEAIRKRKKTRQHEF